MLSCTLQLRQCGLEPVQAAGGSSRLNWFAVSCCVLWCVAGGSSSEDDDDDGGGGGGVLPDGGSVLLDVPLTTLEALYQQHLVDEDYLDKVHEGEGRGWGGCLGGGVLGRGGGRCVCGVGWGGCLCLGGGVAGHVCVSVLGSQVCSQCRQAQIKVE